MEISELFRSVPEESAAVPQTEPRPRLLTLLNGAVFYGLMVLVALVAIPYGTRDAWAEGLFECGVFLLCLLWIIHGLLAGSWAVGNMRVFYPVMALIGFALLQSWPWWQIDWAGNKVWFDISADPFESRRFALKTSALLLAGLLLIRYTSSKQRFSLLIHGIAAIAVVSALFGITRQAVQHTPGFFLPVLTPGGGYGQFINKNHFAFLMEMAMGLCAGVAFMSNEHRERILIYLSALLLMWVALVLSNSRGGLFAMVVQVVCAPPLLLSARAASRPDEIATTRRRVRSIVALTTMVVVLLFTVAVGIIWLGGDQLATGVETASSEMSGVDRSELHEGARRRDIWRATWLMFKAHPFVGAGFGGYWAEVPVFHEASGVLTPQQAHNDYLEILASGGLVGAALLVWFAIALTKQARESLDTRDGFQRAAALGAIIGLVGVSVHSIVDFGLHLTINALVFVALLAILSLSSVRSLSLPMRRRRQS